MKGKRWINFVAARYVSRGRRNSPSPILSVLGIATGVLALIIIIAVMNGFQLGFIESILEMSSCHLRLEHVPDNDIGEIRGTLSSLSGVISVLPFKEHNVLLRGRNANPRGALIRAVPADALVLDPGLAGKLVFEDGDGFFNIDDPQSIVLGAELARFLSVHVGDPVNLLSITEMEGGSRVYFVSGIFSSGFYEYDLGWGFFNMDTEADDSFTTADTVLGIKLKNRWQDQHMMSEIKKVIHDAPNGVSLTSWRDYNRSFFGALRTEKLMMFILLALIFIVVGLNIFQAQRRMVLERREEIGLLRALGASDRAVRLIFVWDGFLIGLAGSGIGLVIGLLIAFNIPVFFSFLEGAVNSIIFVVNNFSLWFGGAANVEEFAVFSPRIFYIKEIPSRVIPQEVILIFLFGFLSALMAAWFASEKVSGAKPAEVLRYE